MQHLRVPMNVARQSESSTTPTPSLPCHAMAAQTTWLNEHTFSSLRSDNERRKASNEKKARWVQSEDTRKHFYGPQFFYITDAQRWSPCLLHSPVSCPEEQLELDMAPLRCYAQKYLQCNLLTESTVIFSKSAFASKCCYSTTAVDATSINYREVYYLLCPTVPCHVGTRCKNSESQEKVININAYISGIRKSVTRNRGIKWDKTDLIWQYVCQSLNKKSFSSRHYFLAIKI